MIIPARKDLWEITLPKSLVTKSVSDKFDAYLKLQPSVIKSTHDFLNHSIKKITLPRIRQETAVQKQFGQDVGFRSSVLENNLLTKEFTITFQMAEGFLNYLIMYDIFFDTYRHSNDKKHIDPIKLFVLNSNGVKVAYVEFQQIIFNEIDELELDFSNNRREEFTFDATFSYNKIHFELLAEDNVIGNEINTLKEMSKRNSETIINDTTDESGSRIINLFDSKSSLDQSVDINYYSNTLTFVFDDIIYESKGKLNELIDSNLITILSNNDIIINNESTYGNIIIDSHNINFNLDVQINFLGNNKKKTIEFRTNG